MQENPCPFYPYSIRIVSEFRIFKLNHHTILRISRRKNKMELFIPAELHLVSSRNNSRLMPHDSHQWKHNIGVQIKENSTTSDDIVVKFRKKHGLKFWYPLSLFRQRAKRQSCSALREHCPCTLIDSPEIEIRIDRSTMESRIGAWWRATPWL